MPPDAAASFGSLLYRYWFFGWLFRDASRGNALERDSALRHNAERARWLPTYMRRWLTFGFLMYALGGGMEHVGWDGAAPLAFVSVCFAASVLAISAAAWWILRGPGSAYVRRPDAPHRRTGRD